MRRFLPGVVAHSPQAAVYVADNGSDDGSVEAVGACCPQAALLRLDRNYGFAEGYNRAIARVGEEFVVLLNSDVMVTPGWLSPMLEYLDTHRDVAACQPKILSYRDMSKFEYAGAAGGFVDKWGYPYCRGRIFDTVETDCGQYDTVCDVFWATGAALMVRRDVYEANGGLDARFFAHMEEIDFCWRLGSRAMRIVCVPQSSVYHIGAATLKTTNPGKVYLNFRNNLLMIYKNVAGSELGKVMLFRKIFDNVAAMKCLLTGDVKSFRAIRRARRDFAAMRPDFAEARRENLEKTRVGRVPQTLDGSILWEYYLRMRRKFSQIR